MSLITARVALVHRANILRNAGAQNGWGHNSQAADDWSVAIENLACKMFVFSARPAVEDSGPGRSITSLVDLRLIIPSGAGVRRTDRVDTITYRGIAILDGPLTIEAIAPYADHVELLLRQVS